MRACASVGATSGVAADVAAQAVVLIDGIPEPRLAVRTLMVSGPLDERRATLEPLVDDAALLARWAGAEAVVTMPLRLCDEQVRWPVLARGTMQRVQRRAAEGVAQRELALTDVWATLLNQPMASVWWASESGALLEQKHGVLQPGAAGNRSAALHDVGGETVHVLQAGGEAWTVATALAHLSAAARLGLSLHLLPREVADAALLEPVDLARPVGEALLQVMEPYDLAVQRDAVRDGSTAVERRAVRPMRQGRAVRLRWPDAAGGSLSDALAVEAQRPTAAAQQWIARCDGWVVESTFALVGGWDPALEGAADAAYGRSTSSDFARYANVYRYWVLNEDGHFTAAPYDRGPAYDLAALFGEGAVRPQALPFGPCVVLDDAGEPRPPVVEVSTDSGGSWAQHPGRVVVAPDRAAVYLDDDVLDAGFLSAAKAGAARVRVTASLASPRPMEAARWRGNAFAGTRPPRMYDLHEAFAFRRIDADSVHAADVAAGTLASRATDQTAALERWLVERMAEQQWQAADGAGDGSVTLSGAWPWLRVGDRLIESGGEGVSVGDAREAVRGAGVVVTGLRVVFGVRDARGPRTVADVRV